MFDTSALRLAETTYSCVSTVNEELLLSVRPLSRFWYQRKEKVMLFIKIQSSVLRTHHSLHYKL